MTSNQPDDYQYHRTHTPESPRPIYPPEPSNIPVLKNQNDPAFTDAATYDIRPSSQLDAVEANGAGETDLNQGQTMTQGNENGASAPSGDTPGGAPGGIGAGTNSVEQMQQYGLQPMSNPVDPQFAYQPFPQAAQNMVYAQPGFQLSQTLQTLARSQQDPIPVENDPKLAANTDPFPPQPDAEQRTTATNLENSSDSAHQSKFPPTNQALVSEGVNYQSLLDTLTRAASAAPAGDNVPTQPATAPSNDVLLSTSGNDAQLPSAPGLPPRPPPQEKHSIHPNYAANESIQSYHPITTPNPPTQSYQPQPGSLPFNPGLPPVPIPGNAPGTYQGSNGLPPPPVASFQQSNPPPLSQTQQPTHPDAATNKGPLEQGSMVGSDDGDHKWGPEVQSKYDQFLVDERAYVTEGVWDRFPAGSRMFVGNLPTEKVTKRDLFHIFHKHGKLAQISIKQAYGFVQFLDAADCYRALEAEQGVTIRGRRLHLEISKPQKNTRNAGQGDGGRQAGRKRSRSPERRGPGRRGGGGSDRPPFNDYRDDSYRRRDDYRPGIRSPSPRGHRVRDDYRSRDGQQYRANERSRSPYGRSGGRRRSPSPATRGFDDEAELPIPRRHQNEVPDVQIIELDDIDRNFIVYLENGFRSRGLQCQSLAMSPRFNLAAVIKRQILEGVTAIVKLTRNSQYNGKIPLQVFDRSTGAEVRFNEYVDLDVTVAAEVVVQQKRTQRPVAPSAYPPSQAYGTTPAPPVYGQQPTAPFSQPGLQDPNVTNMISTLDGPALQKLLGAMQQQQTPGLGLNPTPVSASGQGNAGNPDLASLLTNVARQQQQQQQQQQHPSQPHPGPVPNPYGQASSQGYSTGGTPAQDMQSIMNQLAQYRR